MRSGPYDREALCYFYIHDFQKKLEVNRINEANLITEGNLRLSVPPSAHRCQKKKANDNKNDNYSALTEE